jgi:hypothetical protein
LDLRRAGHGQGGTHGTRPNAGRRSLIRDEDGISLVELLVAMAMLLVVIVPVMTMLVVSGRTENRDQAYAQEVQSSQTALARLIHDLRTATSFQDAGPGLLEFQDVDGATTYNVMYDCTAPDSLGAPYTRCARTQAVAPALPPPAGATAGPEDIQHVWNNPTNTSGGTDYATFCNGTGSAPSGGVFFVSNPNTPNTDGSTLACDEAYEDLVAAHPDYVQISVRLPAGGDLQNGGLAHSIVLADGTYLPNLDAGS